MLNIDKSASDVRDTEIYYNINAKFTSLQLLSCNIRLLDGSGGASIVENSYPLLAGFNNFAYPL